MQSALKEETFGVESQGSSRGQAFLSDPPDTEINTCELVDGAITAEGRKPVRGGGLLSESLGS